MIDLIPLIQCQTLLDHPKSGSEGGEDCAVDVQDSEGEGTRVGSGSADAQDGKELGDRVRTLSGNVNEAVETVDYEMRFSIIQRIVNCGNCGSYVGELCVRCTSSIYIRSPVFRIHTHACLPTYFSDQARQ